MNKWIGIALRVLMLTPKIVQKVEETHANASGAEKKAAAQEWLNFAADVAADCVPEQSELVRAVQIAGGAAIDATVAIANAVGGFSHKPTAAPAAP